MLKPKAQVCKDCNRLLNTLNIGYSPVARRQPFCRYCEEQAVGSWPRRSPRDRQQRPDRTR